MESNSSSNIKNEKQSESKEELKQSKKFALRIDDLTTSVFSQLRIKLWVENYQDLDVQTEENTMAEWIDRFNAEKVKNEPTDDYYALYTEKNKYRHPHISSKEFSALGRSLVDSSIKIIRKGKNPFDVWWFFVENDYSQGSLKSFSFFVADDKDILVTNLKIIANGHNEIVQAWRCFKSPLATRDDWDSDDEYRKAFAIFMYRKYYTTTTEGQIQAIKENKVSQEVTSPQCFVSSDPVAERLIMIEQKLNELQLWLEGTKTAAISSIKFIVWSTIIVSVLYTQIKIFNP